MLAARRAPQLIAGHPSQLVLIRAAARLVYPHFPLSFPRSPPPFSLPRPYTPRISFAMASTDATVDKSSQPRELPVSGLPGFPNCSPETNPLDTVRAHIATELAKISGADSTIIHNAIQWTAHLDKGDFILAVPAIGIKGRKPNELAAELAEKFPESPLIKSPRADGIYLQFFIKPDVLASYLLPTILQRESDYGRNTRVGLRDPDDPSKGKKRIVIEFSSPNIAKTFHAGHLRSTIIGGFLAHLYEQAGWEVIRINYLGDWGKQYGLLALGFEKYGDEEALARDPIGHLNFIYVEINKDLAAEKAEMTELKAAGKDASHVIDHGLDEQARKYFKRMTEGDEEVLKQWRRFRELSIERYMEMYARLNIHFDHYSGESQVPAAAIDDVIRKLAEKGLSEESDGAAMINFSKHVEGKAGKSLERIIIQRSDGTALYMTRDIAELLERKKNFNFDKIIYVISSQQDLYVKQLFKIVELLGHSDIAAQCQHISYGLVLGMSARKGTGISLSDVIKDASDAMHTQMRLSQDGKKYEHLEKPEATAETLGISSVMVQDMKGKRINGYPFNLEAMTSFMGDTGPYLQYSHTRLCAIFRKVDDVPQQELESADVSLLVEDHALNLVRLLGQWPDVLTNTMKTLEPSTVITYLFRMTHMLSMSYDHLRIVGSERELMKARLMLYQAAHTVLNSGMRLLGLTPVDRM